MYSSAFGVQLIVQGWEESQEYVVVGTCSDHKSTIHTYPEGIPRALSGGVGLLALPERPLVHEKPSLAPLCTATGHFLFKKIFSLKIVTEFHVIFSWTNVWFFTWLAGCVSLHALSTLFEPHLPQRTLQPTNSSIAGSCKDFLQSLAKKGDLDPPTPSL